MDEFIYSLLLKGTQGLTLLGTLRYRLNFDTAAAGTRDIHALMDEALQHPNIGLFAFGAEGTISVPLLTGATPVPISGAGFGSVAGLLTVLLNSTDQTRSLGLQINPIDSTHIGGGMSWHPGQPGALVFSVLGTQQPFGM
ncbi:hypothetical protein JOD97_000656 [Duganella sp. 1411]|nr:hypothetical protein [Duganella sp. 1411]